MLDFSRCCGRYNIWWDMLLSEVPLCLFSFGQGTCINGRLGGGSGCGGDCRLFLFVFIFYLEVEGVEVDVSGCRDAVVVVVLIIKV